MGFWQTGYYEFHQVHDLEGITVHPKPEVYACSICHKEFKSLNELRAHRFDRHPLRRPGLRIHGQEVGGTLLRITEGLETDDIEISSEIESIRLNGNEIRSADEARELLSGNRNDVVTIELSSQGVVASYNLRFEIASEADLAGVDANFMAMVNTQILDRRAIESFINGCLENKTALTYCDGICEYLYGILAKEKRDTTIPYKEYIVRFSRAADILKSYRQPLGRVIGAIVAFHFNQFEESHHLGGFSRIGSVGQIFQDWIKGASLRQENEPIADDNSFYDHMLTDWDTEQIIGVCTAEIKTAESNLGKISSILNDDIPEVDRAKLWILAAEICRMQNNHVEAAKYARNLLNNPSFGPWAERITEKVKKEN